METAEGRERGSPEARSIENTSTRRARNGRTEEVEEQSGDRTDATKPTKI